MSKESPVCFVIMPFKHPFNSYYKEILKPTIEKIGLKVFRSDEIFGTKPVMTDIWDSINQADIIVADLTTRNSNVFYELGLSHAINKKVVILTQSMKDVPFDLRAYRCLVYNTFEPMWAADLSNKLEITIKSVFEENYDTPFFKSVSDIEESKSLKKIEERINLVEFLTLRESLYRELELQFMSWHGLANCLIFTDTEKQSIKRLKLFANDKFETWLTPLDRLLLSLYWEICENNKKKGLQLIETILLQPEVPKEIQASCLLQQARIHRDHRKNDVNSIFKLLEQANELSPNNISILFLHAKIRNDIGDFKIAAKILEQIRNIPNANFFPIIINLTLADVYIKIRKFKEALELVESYLIFHPYHVKSIKSKASIYCADQSINEATVEQFREQIQAINVGDDPELHFTIALLEYRLKKYEQAQRRLNSIISRRQSYIEYRALLANIFFELNKEEELLKTLDIIKTLVTNAKVKAQVEKVISNIEKKGIEKAKKTGRFDIPLI